MATLKALFIGYFLIALLAGWPILSVAVSGTLASWYGCTLHEGFTNPCMANGTDIGPTLYTMFVMGWFMIATIPMGAIAGAIWTIIWIILNRRSKRAASAVAGT